MVYNLSTNEESIPSWDHMITHDPDNYYINKGIESRLDEDTPQRDIIDHAREKEYRRVARLLEGVDYKVIVGPTLSHHLLSSNDDRLLAMIFGSSHYYNLSAEMSGIAADRTNWYDKRHYRAAAARLIMDRIYVSPQATGHDTP